MSWADSAFDAFSSVVDSALPTIAGVVAGGGPLITDPVSAWSLSQMAPWASAAATYFGTKSTNNTAMSLAAQQQAFSAAQASTIYQRGAADLAAAGINPILAYGSPAAMGSYTTPNIQPSLALAVQSFNSALDAHSSAGLKYSQQHLTDAQSASEKKRPALLEAETGATSAHDAYTRMSTVHEAEKTQLTKIEQKFRSGQIGLQSLEAAVLKTQAQLNTASAKSHYSSAALADAHSNLAHLESILKSPSVRSVLEHPDMHEAGATAGAVSDIAKPVYNLLSSIPTIFKIEGLANPKPEPHKPFKPGGR